MNRCREAEHNGRPERDNGALGNHRCKCKDLVVGNLYLFSDFPFPYILFHFFLVFVFH